MERLVTLYEGQFVAIIDDSVADSDADFSELANRVYAKYGYKDIFMPKVKERKTAEIRSPRITPDRRSYL